MEANNQSIKSLICECEQELVNLEYNIYGQRKYVRYWKEFAQWMESKGFESLTPEIGYQYCMETFGSEVLSGVDKNDQQRLRSVRMLISFQRDGCFEFRTPFVASKVLRGEAGKLMESYLEKMRNVHQFSDSSVAEKRLRLYEFNEYLAKNGINLGDVTTQTLTDFIIFQGYTTTKTRAFSSTIKQLFRHAYDVGAIAIDLSFIVMPVSKAPEKLPTTYTEDEIRRVIASVERGSAIGKRDYLVLLLAAEYGWRASDITAFQFSWIDWDKNIISFDQHKTGVAVQYPLLSSVGNAIVDYLKNGRPDSNMHEIIVGHDTVKRGKRIAPPTIHSIVTRYIKSANIENWRHKKHGPHALRFSLATNLLKKNVSIPVISTILGHQTTESTKRYIALDICQLKKCALPIPALTTSIFEVAI